MKALTSILFKSYSSPTLLSTVGGKLTTVPSAYGSEGSDGVGGGSEGTGTLRERELTVEVLLLVLLD